MPEAVVVGPGSLDEFALGRDRDVDARIDVDATLEVRMVGVDPAVDHGGPDPLPARAAPRPFGREVVEVLGPGQIMTVTPHRPFGDQSRHPVATVTSRTPRLDNPAPSTSSCNIDGLR